MITRSFKQAGYSTAYIGKWHLSSKEYPRRIPPHDLRAGGLLPLNYDI